MGFYYKDTKKKGTLCLRGSFLASENGGKIEPGPQAILSRGRSRVFRKCLNEEPLMNTNYAL